MRSAERGWIQSEDQGKRLVLASTLQQTPLRPSGELVKIVWELRWLCVIRVGAHFLYVAC